MAGVKGKSGGKRAGAGRKPASTALKPSKAPAEANAPGDAAGAPEPVSPVMDGTKRDPLDFLELVMNEPLAPLKDRIRAGIAAAQYRHMKRGDGGKKDEQIEKAKKVAGGKFAAAAPPLKLVRP